MATRRKRAGRRRVAQFVAVCALLAAVPSCGHDDTPALIGTWSGSANPQGQAAANSTANFALRNDSTFTLDVTSVYPVGAPVFSGCTETVHAVGTWSDHTSFVGDPPYIAAVFMSGSTDVRTGCPNSADDSTAPQDLASTDPVVFHYTLSGDALTITLIYAYTPNGAEMAPFDLSRH